MTFRLSLIALSALLLVTAMAGLSSTASPTAADGLSVSAAGHATAPRPGPAQVPSL